MKKIPLFEQCVANVAPEVMEEVNLNIDIANRIYDLLKAKNLTQHEFASRMGKRDSEIMVLQRRLLLRFQRFSGSLSLKFAEIRRLSMSLCRCLFITAH